MLKIIILNNNLYTTPFVLWNEDTNSKIKECPQRFPGSLTPVSFLPQTHIHEHFHNPKHFSQESKNGKK